MKQTEKNTLTYTSMAEMVGVLAPAVKYTMLALKIKKPTNMRDWVIAYCGYLRKRARVNEYHRYSENLTYQEMGDVVGINVTAVKTVLTNTLNDKPTNMRDWVKIYCKFLRDKCIKISETKSINLSVERAKLVREQAKIAYLNRMEAIGEVVPLLELKMILSKSFEILVKELDQIAKDIRVNVPDASIKVIGRVVNVVDKARSKMYKAIQYQKIEDIISEEDYSDMDLQKESKNE